PGATGQPKRGDDVFVSVADPTYTDPTPAQVTCTCGGTVSSLSVTVAETTSGQTTPGPATAVALPLGFKCGDSASVPTPTVGSTYTITAYMVCDGKNYSKTTHTLRKVKGTS